MYMCEMAIYDQNRRGYTYICDVKRQRVHVVFSSCKLNGLSLDITYTDIHNCLYIRHGYVFVSISRQNVSNKSTKQTWTYI